jgi:hypothetical protein
MPKRPTTVKEWTEVLTAWLQVLGLFAAGIFALVEYQGRKDAEKVERAVAYLSKADTDILLSARLKLSDNEQRKLALYDEILLNGQSSQDEVNTAYYQFVVDELVMHSKEPSLRSEFGLVLGFLDEGVICSNQGLCDKSIIAANLSGFGKNFVRTYTPYICYLRQAWSDPSIGRRVEKFYNPTASDSACDEFYTSITKVPKARAGQERAPGPGGGAPNPSPQADG